jgi:hypothetical protein
MTTARWPSLGGAVLGALGGLAAVLLLCRAWPANPDAIADAQALGITSFTVRNGYDESQETRAFFFACVLIPLGAWAGALALSGSSGRRAESAPQPPRAPGPWSPPPWLPDAVIASTAVLSLWRPAFLRGPSPWGSFGLLAEEGVYLGAVQAQRSGRALYADLEFPYGPLLAWSPDLWLRLFSDSIASLRALSLLGHGLGLIAVAAATRAVVPGTRGRWAGAGAALALAVIHPPFVQPLNDILLRPALALLPACLLLAASRDGDTRRAIPAGAALSVAGLIAFDSGGVALLSTAALCIALRPARAVTVRFLAGASAVGLPAAVALAMEGALLPMFAQGARIVSLASGGYQALPYPDALGMFRDREGNFGTFPPADLATAVWAVLPPSVIVGGLAIAATRLRRGGPRLDHREGVGLLVVSAASALLFRGALGRSDLSHLWFYGAVPVALIGAVVLERLGRHTHVVVAPTLGGLAALALSAVAPQESIRFPDAEEIALAEPYGISRPTEPGAVWLGRTGRLRLLPRLAMQVDAVTARVAALPERDSVWFYPSEAAYAFLTNRPPPSRFLWAYDAATSAMQEAAVRELQASPPQWIVRATDTFEIDGLPQRELAPAMEMWIERHYRAVETLPGAVLLQRAGGGE